MQTTPKGNISTKRAPGQTWRKYVRLQRIATLDLSGRYTDDEIALHEGVTKQYVNMCKRTPEYIAIRLGVANGIIDHAHVQMFEDMDQTREVLRSMVPDALLAVRDTLLDKGNPNLRFKAAQEILDREGTLAKVSKTEIKSTVKFDYEEHDQIEADLLTALQDNSNKSLGDLGIESFTQTQKNEEDHKKLQEAYDIINDVTMQRGTDTIQ